MHIKKITLKVIAVLVLLGAVAPIVAMDGNNQNQSNNNNYDNWQPDAKYEDDVRQIVLMNQSQHNRTMVPDVAQTQQESAQSLDDNAAKKNYEQEQREKKQKERKARDDKHAADKVKETVAAVKRMEKFKSQYVGNDDEARKAFINIVNGRGLPDDGNAVYLHNEYAGGHGLDSTMKELVAQYLVGHYKEKETFDFPHSALKKMGDRRLISLQHEKIGRKNIDVHQQSTQPALLIGKSNNGGKFTACAVLNNTYVATGSSVGLIEIWNANRGKCVAEWDAHCGPIYALALLPNGRLVSGGYAGMVRIWNLYTRNLVAEFEQFYDDSDYPSRDCISLKVLSNGCVAIGFSTGHIAILDPDAQMFLETFHAHGGAVAVLDILPNGDLVSGSNDGTVKIWDIKNYICKREINISWEISDLTVLPNGEIAVAREGGNGIYILNVLNSEANELVQILTGHNHPVDALVQLPNGDLVSGSADGTVKVWRKDNDVHALLGGGAQQQLQRRMNCNNTCMPCIIS